MLARILGVHGIKFTNSQGELVQGTSIYVAYADEHVTGEKTEKFFVKPEIEFPESMKIGDKVNIFFNHKGRVEAITK